MVVCLKGAKEIHKRVPFRSARVDIDILETIYPDKYEKMTSQELATYCENLIKKRFGESIMKNILLFNELAEAGKAKERALELQKELSISYRDLELLSLKDLDLDAFLKALTKDDNVILLGGDGTINHFENQIGSNLIPCPIYLAEAGTGNDFALDVTIYRDEKTKLIKINDFINNLPYVEVKGKRITSPTASAMSSMENAA